MSCLIFTISKTSTEKNDYALSVSINFLGFDVSK